MCAQAERVQRPPESSGRRRYHQSGSRYVWLDFNNLRHRPSNCTSNKMCLDHTLNND